MKRIILSMCVGAVCSVASATNVIREWGGHTSGEPGWPVEYRIFGDMSGDSRVEIYAQAGQPHPSRFEAWDTHTGREGVIDSITIVSAAPLSGIDLRIAPDPNSPYGTHAYGAANVKHIDLLTNGDPANWLTTLLLRGDYGAATQADTLRVGRADTIQIGGNVLTPSGVDAINITRWVSGSVFIGGLPRLCARPQRAAARAMSLAWRGNATILFGAGGL